MEKATILFLAICGLVAIAVSGPTRLNPFAALPCNVTACNANPNCHCSSQASPGGMPRPDTPQIVFLTFDDGITVVNYPFYRENLFDRKNPNGAPIVATFFVTHEYNNYSLTHDLWARGHEIALHSITHTADTGYWQRLNETGWRAEVIAQRQQLSQFAAIPQTYLRGFRSPFLQMGGEHMFSALTGGNLEWDCSRPTQNQRTPGLWPYTNDYASTQDCAIPTCPVESYPGFWTFPMIDFMGDDQFPCAMVDECTPVPMTRQATFNMLMRNFNDQYNGNRAPFGVFVHAGWLVGDDNRPEYAERTAGYAQFLDEIQKNNDVFIVGISQAMEWMKRPTTVDTINTFVPWLAENRTRGCEFPRNCRYENGTWERFMSSCIPCPANYPWVDNPLGTTPLETVLEYD